MVVKAKALIQSKTFWLAVAQAAVGVYIAITTQYPDLASVGWIAAFKSIIDIFLRYNSNTPVSGLVTGGTKRIVLD